MTRLAYISFFAFIATFLNAQQKRTKVSLDLVAEQARKLIESPMRQAEPLPEVLQALSYDDYRNIRFRPSEALWWNTDSSFRVEFFHPGYIFNDQVQIFEASDTHVQEVPFLKGGLRLQQ